MTTIQDTVRYLDGSTARGKILISWPPFQFAGIAVAAGRKSFPIASDGSIQITCYPTIGAQPLGVYYTATYQLDKGSVYDEYWLVPSTPATNIPTIRASIPETPSIMINAQQLTSAGAASGQFLGWNGASWVPMWVSDFNGAVQSFFGRTGNIQPQAGDYDVSMITGLEARLQQIEDRLAQVEDRLTILGG